MTSDQWAYLLRALSFDFGSAPPPDESLRVTAELAAKYVNAQILASTQSAETTREFINNQLAQAKTNMEALEKEGDLLIVTENGYGKRTPFGPNSA